LGSVPALDLRWRSGPDAEILVDLLYLALDDLEPLAIHDHETADGWRVFFRNSAYRDAAASALRAAAGARELSIDSIDVADDNWAKRSQEALRAIRAGGIVVAPPWDATDNADGTVVIVIEPSMGFGTGHHETTRLCLELLQELELHGRRAIDAGTGSGVLAIAASKLGASAVVAFDEDPQALENARENVARNGVSSQVVVRELDLGSPAFDLQPAAVVMANLTSGVLLKYARRLEGLVDADGVLLISGFAPEELPELVEAFGASSVRSKVEGAWAAACLQLRGSRSGN